MTVMMSEKARCLTCGYLLRDLPQSVCPECGRAFDPADSRTYDAEPEKRRRRRWIKRSALVLSVLLLIVGFFPRRAMKGTVTFTCANCGETITVHRWEPVPPDWIALRHPFRYPGCHWTSLAVSGASDGNLTTKPTFSCPAHVYGVQVRFDLYGGGWCSATGSILPGGTVYVCYEKTNPATAAAVLKSLMSPLNNGITICCGTISDDELREKREEYLREAAKGSRAIVGSVERDDDKGEPEDGQPTEEHGQ
ncbi:MAG: hypothetical protein V2A79_16090 [Planctomycetota bacterium]